MSVRAKLVVLPAIAGMTHGGGGAPPGGPEQGTGGPVGAENGRLVAYWDELGPVEFRAVPDTAQHVDLIRIVD